MLETVPYNHSIQGNKNCTQQKLPHPYSPTVSISMHNKRKQPAEKHTCYRAVATPTTYKPYQFFVRRATAMEEAGSISYLL